MDSKVSALLQEIIDQEGPNCEFTKGARALLSTPNVSPELIAQVESDLKKLEHLNITVDGEKKARTGINYNF